MNIMTQFLTGINAIEAFQKTNTEIPVNLKFLFEGTDTIYLISFIDHLAGMEEQGSPALNDYLQNKTKGYFDGVKFVTIVSLSVVRGSMH